jgi:hypothetical protein
MQMNLYSLILRDRIDYIINIDEIPMNYDLVDDKTFASCSDVVVLISKINNPKKRVNACLRIMKPMKE